ncbi:hypothetical protein AC579_4793 [Pseudocercospora musae]|uniref:Aminoglycoside phosphotransferase domain-containing protein n=1 Tax=Pseudocercospora musae TaxID=113226 RepID=A0A139H7Y8_9PEZI|nr:hypothetical protein AC579_4793 [Pseudocercospora musae]
MNNFYASSLSRRVVMQFCDDPDRNTIGRMNSNPEVIRVGDMVIKFGRVSLEEACNQHAAATLVNPEVLVVPKVYDYFQSGDRAFLVMQFVQGRHPTVREYSSVLPEVAKSLAYLHTFTRHYPGPYAPGRSLGLLWCDDVNVLSFVSKDALASYLNSRLRDKTYAFDFKSTTMVFCHLDVAPRNIVVTNDRICLLDWESAGFYPRSLERCAIRRNCGNHGEDGEYCTWMDYYSGLQEPLSPEELLQAQMVDRVVGNNIRYDFSVPTGRKNRRRRRLDLQAAVEERQTDS